MNCEEYEILLSARLDGALTPEETARLEAHLAQCPQCRQLAQELETLQAQTAALTQEVPRALQENLEGRDWSRPSQENLEGPGWSQVPRTGPPFQKGNVCCPGPPAPRRRRPDGLASPRPFGAALSEGFAALSPCRGPGGEHHRRDSTQSADPEEEASDQTDGATPPDDGAAEGDTNAPLRQRR